MTWNQPWDEHFAFRGFECALFAFLFLDPVTASMPEKVLPILQVPHIYGKAWRVPYQSTDKSPSHKIIIYNVNAPYSPNMCGIQGQTCW